MFQPTADTSALEKLTSTVQRFGNPKSGGKKKKIEERAVEDEVLQQTQGEEDGEKRQEVRTFSFLEHFWGETAFILLVVELSQA